jgi:TolB protein
MTDSSDALALYVVNESGRNLTLLSTVGSFPDWSPGGDGLAYSTWEGGGRIQVWNHSDRTTISIERPFSSHPRFSPDGARIALTADAIGRGSLLILTVGTGNIQRLADNATGFVEWSPDGHRLAFTSADDDSIDLMLIDVQGSPGPAAEARRLTEGASVSYPAWAPTGDRIVFLSREQGNDDLFLLDTRCIDESGVPRQAIRRLTDTPENERSPVWFPDGLHVAYATGSDSSWRILLLNVESLASDQIVGGLTSPDSLDAYPY